MRLTIFLKDCPIECVSELVCDQEEADTKLFLCTKLVEALEVSAAGISTMDYDTAIYALYFALKISIPKYIEIGTKDRRRCIDIGNVVSETRRKVFLALPLIGLQEMIIPAPLAESVKLKH